MSNLQNNNRYFHSSIYPYHYFNIFTSRHLPNSLAKIYLCLYFSYKNAIQSPNTHLTRFIQLCCRNVLNKIY